MLLPLISQEMEFYSLFGETELVKMSKRNKEGFIRLARHLGLSQVN